MLILNHFVFSQLHLLVNERELRIDYWRREICILRLSLNIMASEWFNSSQIFFYKVVNLTFSNSPFFGGPIEKNRLQNVG